MIIAIIMQHKNPCLRMGSSIYRLIVEIKIIQAKLGNGPATALNPINLELFYFFFETQMYTRKPDDDGSNPKNCKQHSA